MNPKKAKRSRAKVSAKFTLKGWRANALDLSLDAGDLDLVDNVLAVVPELRVVMRIGQEARRRRLSYPVKDAECLARSVGSEKWILAGHQIDQEMIRRTMPAEWFPIEHEGQLLSLVFLALHRCRIEANQAVPRPILSS